MANTIIGRVLATEKKPTTIDENRFVKGKFCEGILQPIKGSQLEATSSEPYFFTKTSN